MSGARAVEASVPVRIDLTGAPLDVWPLYLFHPGRAVAVAIDRRVWCRVETGADGLRVESKDALTKVEGKDVAEVLASGRLPLVAHVLAALGVETGLRVVTQSKVPAGSGLGDGGALAVAVAAAAAEAAGCALDTDSLCALARDAEARARGAPVGILDHHAAVHGGIVGLSLAPGLPRRETLMADPGRIEEALLLVDSGQVQPAGPGDWEVTKGQIDGSARVRDALALFAAISQRLRDALVGHRYDAVADLVAEQWEARKALTPAVTTPAIDRIVEIARSAGAAAKACGAGGGGMVAVWAPPGNRGPGVREHVEEALRAASLRPLKFRVDLRGLEVES